ncbi:MAG: hypothetical protein ABS939_08830 [Psychrobacillus sp.]
MTLGRIAFIHSQKNFNSDERLNVYSVAFAMALKVIMTNAWEKGLGDSFRLPAARRLAYAVIPEGVLFFGHYRKYPHFYILLEILTPLCGL